MSILGFLQIHPIYDFPDFAGNFQKSHIGNPWESDTRNFDKNLNCVGSTNKRERCLKSMIVFFNSSQRCDISSQIWIFMRNFMMCIT